MWGYGTLRAPGACLKPTLARKRNNTDRSPVLRYMPITVDTLTLTRIAAPAATDTERPVRSITTGPHGYEGEGFPVVRAFAGVSAADLDPFVHMDQMGEVEYQPGEPRGT